MKIPLYHAKGRAAVPNTSAFKPAVGSPVSIPVRTGMLPNVRLNGGDSIGKAIQHSVGVFRDFHARMEQEERNAREQARAIKVGQLHSKAANDLQLWEQGLDTDPDYDTYGQRLDEVADQIKDQAFEQFGDDSQAKQVFTEKFATTYYSTKLKVHQREQEGIKDWSRAAYQATMLQYESVASRGTPSERTQAVAMATGLISAQVAAGNLTAQEAYDERLGFLSSLEMSELREVGRADPDSALEMLKGDWGIHIDSATRQSQIDRYQKEADAKDANELRLAEKAEADAEKAEEAMRKGNAIALFSQIQEGEDVSKIMQDGLRYGMIDISQFKTLRAELERQATGEETMEDDPFVLLEINEAINNGDGVLSQIDIVRQASGRLKPSTIKTLMDKAQTKRNSRESNAEQFIKTQLGGGGLFAGMDAAKDARTANALMEFWEQKGVYDGDVFDLARKLVDEFKQEPSDPRSLPRSKYLPRGDYSIESVSNAMASIRGKFLRGELTKSQAAIEFKKIKDIKNALEEQSQGASSSMIGSEAKRLMNQ